MYCESTKNIDVRYHFIRKSILHGQIRVKKIGTEDNVDIMIKSVPIFKFKNCLDLIGVFSN